MTARKRKRGDRIVHLDVCRCWRCCKTNPRLRFKHQLFVIDYRIRPSDPVPHGFREVEAL